MEAEYAALCEVSREIIYVKRILKHIGFEKYVASRIDVFCDNQSAIKLSKNAVHHKRNKNIDIRYHFSRELAEKKEIMILYLRTCEMPADVLTKALPKCRHLRGMWMLNLSGEDMWAEIWESCFYRANR